MMAAQLAVTATEIRNIDDMKHRVKRFGNELDVESEEVSDKDDSLV